MWLQIKQSLRSRLTGASDVGWDFSLFTFFYWIGDFSNAFTYWMSYLMIIFNCKQKGEI